MHLFFCYFFLLQIEYDRYMHEDRNSLSALHSRPELNQVPVNRLRKWGFLFLIVR